jgi:hypothetical protein
VFPAARARASSGTAQPAAPEGGNRRRIANAMVDGAGNAGGARAWCARCARGLRSRRAKEPADARSPPIRGRGRARIAPAPLALNKQDAAVTPPPRSSPKLKSAPPPRTKPFPNLDHEVPHPPPPPLSGTPPPLGPDRAALGAHGEPSRCAPPRHRSNSTAYVIPRRGCSRRRSAPRNGSSACRSTP